MVELAGGGNVAVAGGVAVTCETCKVTDCPNLTIVYVFFGSVLLFAHIERYSGLLIKILRPLIFIFLRQNFQTPMNMF